MLPVIIKSRALHIVPGLPRVSAIVGRYGYSNSKNVAPNLFYCKAGVVYYTAAVGIVFDEDSRTQRFFLGHDDDIRCLALHPDLDTIATGQFGAVPSVLIWSAETTQGPAARPAYPSPSLLISYQDYTACCSYRAEAGPLFRTRITPHVMLIELRQAPFFVPGLHRMLCLSS